MLAHAGVPCRRIACYQVLDVKGQNRLDADHADGSHDVDEEHDPRVGDCQASFMSSRMVDRSVMPFGLCRSSTNKATSSTLTSTAAEETRMAPRMPNKPAMAAPGRTEHVARRYGRLDAAI